MMEVEHGLHLQTSHLIMALHLAMLSIVFLVLWLSNLIQHQGVPGKLAINGDSLGLPGRDPNSEAQVGLRAWGFHPSPRRVCPWTPDHTWENPAWSCSLPQLVRTFHAQGFLRFSGTLFCSGRSQVLTGKLAEEI